MYLCLIASIASIYPCHIGILIRLPWQQRVQVIVSLTDLTQVLYAVVKPIPIDMVNSRCGQFIVAQCPDNAVNKRITILTFETKVKL
jgi:hypothetical protein